MKILKEEQQLLNDRKEQAFQRFLDRCETAYHDCSVWSYVMQKAKNVESLWHDLEYPEEKLAKELDAQSISQTNEESEDQADKPIDQREENE